MLVSLDRFNATSVSVNIGGDRIDYALAPDWPEDDDALPTERATSHSMLLNGKRLVIGSSGELPSLNGVSAASGSQMTVPALGVRGLQTLRIGHVYFGGS